MLRFKERYWTEAKQRLGNIAVSFTRATRRAVRRCLRLGVRYSPLLMVLLTAAIAAGTFWYAAIARDQLSEQRKDFAFGNRPYVIAEPQKFQNVGVHGARWIYESIALRNRGKGLAVHVSLRAKMFTGIGAGDLAKMAAQQLEGMTTDGAGSIIAPDKSDFFTASSGPFRADEITAILSADLAVYTIGRVWYQDIDGNLYTTDFCVFRLTTGAVALCRHFNEIH